MLNFLKLELKQILSPILPALKKVDSYINEFISSDLEILEKSAKHVFSSSGKKIRASLTLLGAATALFHKGHSETIDTNLLYKVVPLSAGIELVHAATLIHDDIIDNANNRRGVSTVSKKWDNKVAVLVGDWMFTRGLDIAALEKNSQILPTLISATREMVKGELMQLQYSSIESITRDRYISIIGSKTAKYLGACIQVGAMSQWLEEQLAHELSIFGYLCGLGFQIIDDSIDFTKKKISGKDEANDYMEGKVTLPVINLIADKPNLRKEITNLYLNRDMEKFYQLKGLIIENGILEKTLEDAKNFIDQGIQRLTKFTKMKKKENFMSDNVVNPILILEKLALYFINRDY